MLHGYLETLRMIVRETYSSMLKLRNIIIQYKSFMKYIGSSFCIIFILISKHLNPDQTPRTFASDQYPKYLPTHTANFGGNINVQAIQ